MSNMRAERTRLGLSQKELAFKLHCSESAVRAWESDSRLPRIHQVVAMADLFGCSVDWLLGRSEERLAKAPTVGRRDD